MANPYFRNLPDFEYVNTTSDGRSISDYVTVKNLFKKGKLREDIATESTFFEKYTVKGNDRPDNVAFEVYGDPTLDWVVLLSNNIINVYKEWAPRSTELLMRTLQKNTLIFLQGNLPISYSMEFITMNL